MRKRSSHLVKRCLWFLCGISLVLGLELGAFSSIGWSLPTATSTIAPTITPTVASNQASQAVQQGVDAYQAGQFQTAIEQWQAALSFYQQQQERAKAAIVLENLARAYHQLGQTNQEIEIWQQALALYRQLGNRQQVGRVLTEQAQIYSRQGHSRQAIALLCGEVGGERCDPESALQLARQLGDREGETAALGSLGAAYRLRGNYTQAIESLNAAQHLATEIGNEIYLAAVLNDLGHAHRGLAKKNYQRATAAAQIGDDQEANQFRQAGQTQDQQAITYLNQSLTAAQRLNDRPSQLRALLNLLPLYHRTTDSTAANATQQQVKALLETLPDSQEKVYGTIELAHLLQPITREQPLSVTTCFDATVAPEASALLQQALSIAQRIGNARSQSFALGELGHYYECQQDYEQAIALTQQARWAAEQNLQAKDSLYQWEWQTGRILKAQGEIDKAIQVYEKAVSTLEAIRTDLLITNRDLQFDFRDTVDPVYRDLVELRLNLEQANALVAPALKQNRNSAAKQDNINAALKTLDSLRLAELQNYFGDDCAVLAAATVSEDAAENATAISAGNGQATAIFSSVILDDRTGLIVTLPNGQQQIAWVDVDRDELISLVNQYRLSLERFFEPFDFQFAQQLYRSIIRPFEETLAQAQIKTLVFVQDGILRSVPMAALHDGQQFLIQKYAIATTPSLTLTSPTPLKRDGLRALALGLTNAVQIGEQTFPALNYVNQEIQAIESELPGSKQLLNQDFTRARIQQELARSAYPILHLSTHGQFGIDPENTFLITGDQQKLSLPGLEALIRGARAGEGIELLTLTACETAIGDDRAALGLGGVAIQAGAKSALASLWFVDDQATAQLATQFYANLRNTPMSKAEALQAAQVSLIESGTGTNSEAVHPAYWAAFILIGNWL